MTVTVTDSLGTYTAMTDYYGAYTIFGVADGSFTVKFEKIGFLPRTFNGTKISGQIYTRNIDLYPVGVGSQITGYVYDAATGTRISSAKVTITDSPSVGSMVYTDANGDYAIEIYPGAYSVFITKQDYNPYTYSGVVFGTQTLNVGITRQTPIISNISTSGLSATSATISWTTDQQTSSILEYGVDTSYGNTVSDPSLSTSHTTTLSNLTQGTTYHFRITSTNSNGLSSRSPDKTFSTPIPPIITSVTITARTIDSATISWRTDQPSSSKVEYGTSSAYGSMVSDPTMTVNHVVSLPGLTPGATYHYKVSSTNSYSLTSSSTDSTFATIGYPVISAVTVTNITAGSATITWTTDQSSNSLIEYGTTTSYGSSVADQTSAASHSVTISNLSPGVAYHFRVTSTNSYNLSSSSADVAFTTVGTPVISSVAIGNVTSDSTTITWTTDQLSDSLVEYGTTTSYGSTAGSQILTTSHNITLNGLTPSRMYHFRVMSRNAYGLSSSSDDGTFTTATPITVTITSPAEGSTIQRPEIMVKGTITNATGNETGVTVNGVVANIYGNEFVANHVPLVNGTNTITVTATDTAGYTATVSITVTSTAGNYITLTSNIDFGISALEPTLRADGYASGTTPSISYLGPGSVDWTNCTSYDACKVKMTVEGVYYFTASGTGPDGNTYQDAMAVTVLSKTEIDTLLKAKWEGMKTALTDGNIEEAVNYFAESSRPSFRYRFNLLAAQLSQIVVDMGLYRLVDVTEYLAEYDLRAVRNGTTYSYQVLFMRDLDGIWKIRSF